MQFFTYTEDGISIQYDEEEKQILQAKWALDASISGVDTLDGYLRRDMIFSDEALALAYNPSVPVLAGAIGPLKRMLGFTICTLNVHGDYNKVNTLVNELYARKIVNNKTCIVGGNAAIITVSSIVFNAYFLEDASMEVIIDTRTNKNYTDDGERIESLPKISTKDHGLIAKIEEHNKELQRMYSERSGVNSTKPLNFF